MLEIKNLTMGFGTSQSDALMVLDGISLSIQSNETVAIVGESGCGKSITAKSIMKLLKTPPAQYIDGQILFHSENILSMSDSKLRSIRGNRISMIFQEPLTSLNPVLTIGDQLEEVLKLHGQYTRAERRARCIELLKQVNIPDPELRMKNYPEQFSGGMRQRIMIAMATACKPELLIADEPTTALDVTIQAQILAVLKTLQETNKMSILLITHDLGVVANFTKRVIVMYAGQIVEEAPTYDLFLNPKHPYTIGLLDSLPKMNAQNASLHAIEGMVPSIRRMPSGCRFRTRCKLATQICAEQKPEAVQIAEGHRCYCHHVHSNEK